MTDKKRFALIKKLVLEDLSDLFEDKRERKAVSQCKDMSELLGQLDAMGFNGSDGQDYIINVLTTALLSKKN